MCITTLFDKSFLQSLSLDEAVWFDNFFIGNICPIFYVESLADLEKKFGSRPPEEEVRILADKFPELHGMPNAYHRNLCTLEMLGNRVHTTGQIVVPGGLTVKAGNQIGVKFPTTPEAEAFARWQRKDFRSVEREIAAQWREDLRQLNLRELAKQVPEIISTIRCKSLSEAKDLAMRVVKNNSDKYSQIELFIKHLDINPQYRTEIVKRLASFKFPNLAGYAPYSTHVLTVDLFFRIALASGLISSNRQSNWVDISYLFYLPFCQIFVSTDKLHRNCAPLFLRDDQCFVWGNKLKEGLKEINRHYSDYPESIKCKGITKFANHPPMDLENLVSDLWDKFALKWRRIFMDVQKVEDENKIIERLRKFNEAEPSNNSTLDNKDPNFTVLKRVVQSKRGSWKQISGDID